MLQSLTQRPLISLPALPALWSALNWLAFSVTSLSIPRETFILLILESPLSITVVTPGTVKEVSAIDDDKIIRLGEEIGTSERIFFCSDKGTEECKVKISASAEESEFSNSERSLLISAIPGRKKRIESVLF